MKHLPKSKLQFRQSASYEIRVQGILHNNWDTVIKGMNMRILIEDNVTIIKGIVTDQSHLSGILNTLFDIRLPIISVNIEES